MEQKVSELKAGIDEAKFLIQKMDLDARSLQPNDKAVLHSKLREYKADLNSLKGEIEGISSAYSNSDAREDLLESGMADSLTASIDQETRLMISTERLNQSGDKIKEDQRTMIEDDQETRLMMSTERLNQSHDRIKEDKKTMIETEDLAISILQNLNSQRQPLLHGHDTLHGVDDNIGKSRRVLTSISRMNRNKWIVGSIFVLLMIAIILIVYFKLSE